MAHKIAKTWIVKLRKQLGIPEAGFLSQSEAWTWYQAHFKAAKGHDFTGRFGFRFDRDSNRLEFDYQGGDDGLFIGYPYPLDSQVPLDREALGLARKLELEEWVAPALRLIMLMAKLTSSRVYYLPDIPTWLIAPLGQLRVLVHPATRLSLRGWRRIGERLGFHPSTAAYNLNVFMGMPAIVQEYGKPRKSKKEEQYLEVLKAYYEVRDKRRKEGRRSNWGVLKETANLLMQKYGRAMDSYTVKRYLDRAIQRWYITESKL